MLARPEIGSREHMLLWLASKDPNETYNWRTSKQCACGVYAREHGLETFDPEVDWGHEHLASTSTSISIGPIIRNDSLNGLAQQRPWAFGALYERAREAWA